MRKRGIWYRAVFLITTLSLLILSEPVFAQSTSQTHKVVIYLFWGDGCPHCAVAKPFLTDLSKRYSNVELRVYEVWYVAENQDLFVRMAASYGFEPHGVPTIMIGDQYWEGYNDQVALEVERQVQTCSATGCKDAGVGIIPGAIAEEELEAQQPSKKITSDEIVLPLVGPVHLASQSLWVSTALISFVDGINPCSVWVLTMLLAITLHTGSRKKVVTIGLIFLTVTAGVYALFIAGLFTAFSAVSFMGWIRVVVALVALFFGLINIKDYFWYKEGLSLTISDEKKPGIYEKMRQLVDASQSFWGLAGATIVLAAGVSLVEFSCTAGFPVIWTNILVAQKISALTFILLLLLYLIIYQLDEMAIFFTAVFTLKATRLEEKHGRILKLIGGILMLTLSVVMLINPALMNTLDSSLRIFTAASLTILFILLVHRIIFPRLGIRFGSETTTGMNARSRRRRH
jgi:thiol-disulfide isomerase/thioredoxin